MCCVRVREASHLGPPQQQLQLLLGQQAVVLHEGGHFRGALHLEVHRPVNLHVAVEHAQEALLALQETPGVRHLRTRHKGWLRDVLGPKHGGGFLGSVLWNAV